VCSLDAQGHRVMRLVRRPAATPNEVQWEPMGEIPAALVSGFDVVIHLSGENVAGRWNAGKMRRIRESRVVSAKNLVAALTRSEKPPHMFLCASAIGYYGDRGDETLSEESPPGTGFLAEVCREWEAATEPAARAGIRVANLRFGIVLSRDDGALKQMLLPFRLGIGGRIGSGKQWWSWIHIEDAAAAVLHVMEAGAGHVRGAVNITSPNPVTNAEFTKALAHALKRPAVFAVPAFAARVAFGEFANGGLLASARVAPKRLTESGFEFRYPNINEALAKLLA
jgi:uncharacterized protein